jgi:hypothetical protein
MRLPAAVHHINLADAKMVWLTRIDYYYYQPCHHVPYDAQVQVNEYLASLCKGKHGALM